MITGAIFNQNENLRGNLKACIDVLNVAAQAVQADMENEYLGLSKGDALVFSMAHAERQGIAKFMRRIRELAEVPRDTVGALEASYHGVTEFDRIAIDAEQEQAQIDASRKRINKTTKKK